jgi:ABC-type lipoprotein export system ATPase subunit
LGSPPVVRIILVGIPRARVGGCGVHFLALWDWKFALCGSAALLGREGFREIEFEQSAGSGHLTWIVALLDIVELRKSFIAPDGVKGLVVDVPAFALAEKQQVALAGQSGSGKTTFLNLIAGILTPDSGTIRLAGQEVSAMSESKRDRLRATSIGYIFQTFNLLHGFTVLENVVLGMAFGPGVDKAFAETLLHRVGLQDRLHHRPRQLSTGQQQRVAVARALANRPKLVLADEPTGNLDHRSAGESLELIREACAENGAALLLVSHDREVLGRFDERLDLAEINRAAAPSPVPPDDGRKGVRP